jgi:hypothetical protein
VRAGSCAGFLWCVGLRFCLVA